MVLACFFSIETKYSEITMFLMLFVYNKKKKKLIKSVQLKFFLVFLDVGLSNTNYCTYNNKKEN